MKISIEEYRGFEICFDTDKEVFHGMSTSYDTELSSKSFSACKGQIDGYIKDNTTFHPFWVVDKNGHRVQVVGVRKDKRFMGEKDGAKFQISDYNEKDYFVDRPEFVAHFEKKNELNDRINLLYKEVRGIDELISGKTLRDVKLEMGI